MERASWSRFCRRSIVNRSVQSFRLHSKRCSYCKTCGVWFLRYVYPYLRNRKQCVRINNTYSNYQKIISGVPQGSILRPIFPNLSVNDLFFFLSGVSIHNFANDNALSAFAKTISALIDLLQSGPEIVIDWFTNNKMIVNPDKFQAILLDKTKSDHTN